MVSEVFRVLVLGGGPVVRFFHLPALEAQGWLNGALVVDSSAQSLAKLTASTPGVRTQQGDFQDVLAEPEISERFDAVLIALPNSLHAAAVARAIRAGLPVLCEKPLAMTGADAGHLAALTTKSGVMLSVGMVMRHLPGVLALRRALAQKLVGDVLSVDVEDGNPFTWDSDSGGYFNRANGGVLLNIGVHYLDLLAWLFGPLSATRYEDDADGGVEANSVFDLLAGQVPVRIAVSYSRRLRNTLIVKGTRGELLFDKTRPDGCEWIVDGMRGHLTIAQPFATGPWEQTLMGCFAEQLGVFARAVAAKSSPPVPVEDAVAAGQLIDWAMAHRQLLEPELHTVDVSAEALRAVTGKVVVTGATGFVGSRLVGALVRSGCDELVALVRSFRSGAMAGRLGARQVKGDLLDVESIRSVCRGAKHVFHLAYGSDGKDADRITIAGAENVCRAAAKEGVESVVLVGTTAVYGPSSMPVNESAPLRTTGSAYVLAKAEMVRRVLRLAGSGELGQTRVVVLEPACIFGPGGKPFTEMPLELARTGGLVWVADGSGAANVVYVDNLVEALLRAAVCIEAHGQRFIIQDCCVKWRQFLEPLLGPWAKGLRSMSVAKIEALNKVKSGSLRDVLRGALCSRELGEALRKWAPAAWSLRLMNRKLPCFVERLRSVRHGGVARIVVQKMKTSDSLPVSCPPSWQIELYGPGNPVLIHDRARRVLGWSPRVPLDTGLRRSVGWLRYVRLRD